MKKIVFIIVATVLLMSCTLESEFSLPKDKRIDKELLGTWHPIDSKGSLIIKKAKNKTFSITMIDEKGKTTVISPNAFTPKINNHKLINLVSMDEGKVINSFYEYKIVDEKFRYREVRKTKQKFTSNKDLLNYFTNNIDKEGFFDEWDNEFFFTK